MKKIILINLTIVLLSINSSFAQFNNKIYNFDSGIGKITTDKSHNLIFSEFFSESNYCQLFKSDSSNNIIWKKQIPLPTSSYTYTNIIEESENNIFVLSNNNIEDYLVLTKLDSNGTFLWSKKIYGAGTGICQIPGIIISKEKNIYIGFHSCSYPNIIVKLDSLGNFIWSKSYKMNNLYQMLQSIVENGNYGLIIRTNLGLININSAGNVIWNNSYNFPLGIQGDNVFTNMKRDLNGNCYFAENLIDNNNFLKSVIVKTDSVGNLIWAQMYQYSNFARCFLNQIDLDAAGNLYAAGHVTDTSTNNNVGFVMKISTLDGQVKNTSGGDDTQPNLFLPRDLKCINENRILVSGSCNGLSCQGDVFVAMDSTGTGICGFDTITMIATPYIIGTSVQSIQQFQETLNYANMNFTVQPSIINSLAFCPSIEPPSGVGEIRNVKGISISPNPFTSQTTITFNEEQKNTSLIITDVLGNIIQQLTTNNKQLTLDMSGFTKGIYFVRIEDENKNVVNRKVVLQ